MSESRTKRYGKDWDRRRIIVLERDGYVCWICGRDEANSVDHVIRLTDGGTNEYTNLRAAHLRCNISRSSRLPRPHLRKRSAPLSRARVGRWA